MRGQQSCRHCGRGSLSRNVLAGIQVLEDKLGCQVNCNSGCRCKEHNDATAGSGKFSQHITRMNRKPHPDGCGNAVDIWSALHTMSDVYWAAVEIPVFYNGGIGIYIHDDGRYFIHLDCRGSRARWAFMDGKHVSFDDALAIVTSEDLKYNTEEDNG